MYIKHQLNKSVDTYYQLQNLPEETFPFLQAFFVLGGSLVSEGATWLVAFNSVRKGAKEVNMSIKDYSKSRLMEKG